MSRQPSMRKEIVISTDKFGPPSQAFINSSALYRQVAPQLNRGMRHFHTTMVQTKIIPDP